MIAKKTFIACALLVGTICTTKAQQALTLDSCRALAMANNKELLISREKMEAARHQRKAAFANYLPAIDATGAYIRTQKEISLLSDEQKEALGSIGTQLSGRHATERGGAEQRAGTHCPKSGPVAKSAVHADCTIVLRHRHCHAAQPSG